MASDNAINIQDYTSFIAGYPDSQEVVWQKTIVLGQRGRVNPFHGLIGGLSGMKPITQVMDFKACKGTDIVITLDRPLGGPGTQGAASLQRLTGREELTVPASYRCKVGLFAHATSGEQIVESETIIGGDWDNRQREKLTEYFAWKQADDIQFEMFIKATARTTIYPNNLLSIDTLTTADYLNLPTIERVKGILNANQAGPFDITKDESGDILKYLVMAGDKAWRGMSGSNQYQQILANADMRGHDNKLFRGGLPDWFGTQLYNWNVEDGVQIGPLGAPVSPIAYLGVALPATTTTTAQQITGGGALAAAQTQKPDPLFFQYYENSQYIGHEGQKRAADITTVRYLAIQILTGADTGKIAIFSYQVNNGNQITMVNRLGASISGQIATTIGNMVYGQGWCTAGAGANGFQGISTGIIPVGSPIYQVNANGVPYLRSIGLGRNAIIAGYGNIAPNRAYGSGGGSPGQRLFQAQDYGRIDGLGYQQVWGGTAAQDANGLANGFVIVISAYQPSGWPDIGPLATT